MSENEKLRNEEQRLVMRRELGLLSSTCYVLGTVIGTGIFVSPKGVLQQSGSVGMAIIVWVLGAVISYPGALCFAELSATIPESGGHYTFVREAFGQCAGFVFLWVEQLMRAPASRALACLALAEYLFQPVFPTCDPPHSAKVIFAVVVIVTITFINCLHVKWGACLHVCVTGLKLTALLLISVLGLLRIGQGRIEPALMEPFSGTSHNVGDIVQGVYYSLYAYVGWDFLTLVTEEVKTPNRIIPRAIFLGLSIAAIVYVLVNISYYAVLTSSEILGTNAVAITFARETMGLVWWIIPLFVAGNLLGSLNSFAFLYSRGLYVGARDRQLPSILAMIHVERKTPQPALIFSALLTIVYLMVGDLYALLDYYVLIRWGGITVSVAGMIYMRIYQPTRHRPIKFHISVALIFLLTCAFLLGVSFYKHPVNCLISIAFVLTGIPVYFILIKPQHKPKQLLKLDNNLTNIFQKVLLCLPTDKDIYTEGYDNQ